MRIVDGMPVYTDAEQFEIEYAESRLDEIRAIKKDFFKLMSRVDAFHHCESEDFKDGYVAMEEALNDLLSSVWHEYLEESHSLYEELPSSQIYKNYVPYFKPRQTTNPATLSAQGVEL